MFGEKLGKILEVLDVTPAGFARLTGIDKAYVSRILNGSRVPKMGGTGIRRLVNGVWQTGEAKERTEALCALIACSEREQEAVVRRLSDWLSEGVPETGTAGDDVREKAPYRTFGEKLGMLMELTGISNVRLGRLMNVDPSYVSRFRSGHRSPNANPELRNGLSAVFLDRAIDQGKLQSLAKLLKVSTEALSDRETAYDLLYEWLFSAGRTDSTPVPEEIIGSIGAVPAGIGNAPMTFDAAANQEILSEETPYYHGVAGLQRSVIRFLGNVLLREKKELLLYSDQNMDWMVKDPFFRAKWSTLMILAVESGVRIRIIHNVRRDVSELSDAIRSWMPLYPSGQIRSYYMKARREERFSTTLFLCPGYASVSGHNVVGRENEIGLYRYETDPKVLEAEEAAFQALLGRSGELAKVFPAGEHVRTEPPKDRYYRRIEVPEDDIRILITDDAVAVERKKPPHFTILFEHPGLCRAFQAYASRVGDPFRKDFKDGSEPSGEEHA